MTKQMSLRRAVELFRSQPRTSSNTYEWYRRQAHEAGLVTLGRITMRAEKGPKGWMVSTDDAASALHAHERWLAQVDLATDDYKRRSLHGDDGDTVVLVWGHYERRDPFHFVVSSVDWGRRRSDGTWTCNLCFTPAEVVRDREECGVCSNWGSCRRDCTASALGCSTCGVNLAL